MKSTIFLGLFIFSLSVFSAIPNEFQVNENIKRGGRLSVEDIQSLKQQGYKTIINIENDYQAILEEKDYAEGLGFQYIANPMSAFETPNDDEVEMLLTELQNPENFPIYVHCKHGRDRTGMLIGLYRVFIDKWTPDRAYQEMLDLGFRPMFFKLKDYFKKKTKGQLVVADFKS